MDTQEVVCIICGSNQWKDVDEFRFKPGGMCLCMVCGFITYPKIIQQAEDLKKFYKDDYRAAPSIQNVFNQQRKMQYHSTFLDQQFKEWQDQKLNPTIVEIGAAFGSFLHWCRCVFPKAFLFGTELTTSYVRCAWHSYKLKLDQDMDYTRKYDLIASYKVAEHIPYIDQELKKYSECLTEGGRLYISVPTWFNILHNFGVGGYSLDYYFHSNHINVWTKILFKTLLYKSGFEIIKENYTYYDSTYLCKVRDKSIQPSIQYEDSIHILDNLDKVKKASNHFDEAKFDEAIKIWPNFPEAHISNYENKRAAFNKLGFDGIKEKVIDKMIQDCPDSVQALIYASDLCMRYSKWDLAIKTIEQAMKMKPNEPTGLLQLGHCFRQLANASQDQAQKTHYYKEAMEVTRFLKQISSQHSQDATTWEFTDQSKIPCPWENPTTQKESEPVISEQDAIA